MTIWMSKIKSDIEKKNAMGEDRPWYTTDLREYCNRNVYGMNSRND